MEATDSFCFPKNTKNLNPSPIGKKFGFCCCGAGNSTESSAPGILGGASQRKVEGPIIHKLYLSAILDLCDRRIVSYVIRDRNDNKLVFDTLDKAVLENPNAHPLFHSDRGFQYTSRTFHKKLLDAGMTQSMSRVGRCIDNGPMEGFWGILKRECYYGHTFTSREQLISTIENYIDYYNNRRYQHRLFIQTPMQAHVSAMNRVA